MYHLRSARTPGHPSQAVVKRLQDSGATVLPARAGRQVTATHTGYTIDTTDGSLPGTLPALMPPGTGFDGVFGDLNSNGGATSRTWSCSS